MGADLDEDVFPVRHQRVDGLLEAHGLAYVAPPVIGAELLAVEQAAGNSGIERHVAGLRRETGQGLLQVGLYGIHGDARSEEHTSELQSRENLVCRLLLEK